MPTSRSDTALLREGSQADAGAPAAELAPAGEAFSEHFSEREVNCFHRCLANGCDRLVPGTGLMLLYLISRDRACGLQPIRPQQQSGLDVAIGTLSHYRLQFEVRPYADVETSVGALPSVLKPGTAIALPTGSAGLSFLARRSDDAAHYLLLVPGKDGRPMFLESPGALGGKAGGALAEVVDEHAELAGAMRCYPRTTGAALDTWGEAWHLAIEAPAEGGRPSCDEVMADLLADALQTPPNSAVATGFDAAMTAALQQSLAGAGAENAEANAACRAYLRDANFAAVHLRAVALAAARLSPAHAGEARSLTSRLMAEVSAARSKYLVKAMLGGGAVQNEAGAFLARVAALWRAYAQRLEPMLAEILSQSRRTQIQIDGAVI